jgi:tetratricopeptide (TPR) repeat protein
MKFRLLTAVWGAEFCDHFVRIAARSLLAAGNFPDLSRRHPTAYTILTMEEDVTRIQCNPVFAALAASGQVEFQTIANDEIDPSNPSSHWTIWGKGVETAKENGEFVIYIMPDILYASGTLLDWAKAFDQGYRAIFTPIPEVVLETTLQELEWSFPAERQLPLDLGVTEVTNLCLKHLHPYHLCMLRNSRHWVVHPESLGYATRGAYVQRVMGSHPICFDPGFFEFNSVYTPTNHFDRIAFLPSTAVSLEPFLKFMSLYYRPWRMVGDRLSNCGWWFDYFTFRANDVESSRSYVFPFSGGWSTAAVARAHASGNFYRAQCLATRAIFRIWSKLVGLGCNRAAEILATAHYVGRLRRYRLLAGHTTVLVPSNEALERAAVNLVAGNELDRRHRLLDVVYDHCFPGQYRFEERQRIAVTGNGELCATAEGSSSDAQATGTVVAGPFELEGFTIYLTDFVAVSVASRLNRERRPAGGPGRSNRVHGSVAGRELIVVHPSFVGSNELRGFDLEVQYRSVDAENNPDHAALVHILEERVKNAFGPVPAPIVAAEEEKRPAPSRAADEGRVDIRSSFLLRVRGRMRRARRALGVFRQLGRGSMESIQKQRIRELLIAHRLEEADSVSIDSAQVWRELGGEFASQGRLEPALYCRRRAVEFSPNDLQVRMEWVRELLIAGRLEEADSAGGVLAQLWRTLGSGLLWEGQSELGLHCLRRAVKADPADLQTRQELVRELLFAGRLDEAKLAGGGVIQLWRNLGGEFQSKGQLELELYCRRRAVAADAADLQVRQELLRALLVAGRFEEANAADGGLPHPWSILGNGFMSEGQHDLALYCRRRAADLDTSDMQARKELVRDLLFASRIQEANAASGGFRPLWRDLAAEFATQGHLELQRYCHGQARGGTSDSSESSYERSFRKIQIEIGLLALHDLLKSYAEEIGGGSLPVWSNGHPGPLECLDCFLATSGRPLDPLRGMAQLLERHSDFAEAWLEKAFLHLEAGQMLLAVDAALEALRARPRFLRSIHNPHPRAEAAALIGSCLERAGLLELAIAAYRTCLSIDQGPLLVRVYLGRLLWRRGAVAEAMQEFTRGMPFSGQLANFPDLPRRFEKLSLN